ncbi:MAG: hypothetical protein N2115_00575 [bacterium]|nr:hypothetical protein [bacterium]
MIILQYIAIVILGTFYIESRIVRDRISEIINFHRLTRLYPSSIIIGYIAGSSSDAQILWLVVFFAGFTGILLKGISLSQYLANSMLILFCAIFFYMLALWGGLNKFLYLRSGARQLWGFASILTIFCSFPGSVIFVLYFLSPISSIFSIFQPDGIWYYVYNKFTMVNFWGINVPAVLYTLSMWVSFGILFGFQVSGRYHLKILQNFQRKKYCGFSGFLHF